LYALWQLGQLCRRHQYRQLNGSSQFHRLGQFRWNRIQHPGQCLLRHQHTLSGPAQAGAGNFAANPLFADAPGGDFRPALGSPAIDAATNQPWMATATDLDSLPRILYGTADLGAYEALSTSVDSDNDGVPDWQEARAGTDPFDPASVLDIVAATKTAPLSNLFVLRWPSTDGRSYRITYATNMATPFAFIAYSNISASPPQNTFTGTLHSYGAGYYRLEVEE
jgi:hypothetical protein